MYPYESVPEVVDANISLHQLLNHLLPGFQKLASRRKNFFVNEVPDHIIVSIDKNVLASLLGNLFNLITGNTENTCIRVSAKAYHDVILMHVKDHSGCNDYGFMSNLEHIQPLVTKIGGYLDITSQRQKTTTIALSFPNLRCIA